MSGATFQARFIGSYHPVGSTRRLANAQKAAVERQLEVAEAAHRQSRAHAPSVQFAASRALETARMFAEEWCVR